MNTIEVHDDIEHHGHADVGFMQMYSIPEYLAVTLFPASDIPISAFVKFAIPSVTSTHQAALPSVHQYFCLEPPHSSPIDHAQTSSVAAMVTNADFDIESEVDLSADGLLAVLAESWPNVDSTGKGKGKAEAEDINGSDDKWLELGYVGVDVSVGVDGTLELVPCLYIFAFLVLLSFHVSLSQ
ncbi:uncharacterized protein EDB93DRAFT_1104064 [Suillus bovinus]|uniref:uncharacterized protein n=1 Tax=Suillus bovinus TaxID=48563 RepID=UPI001B87A92B|nr:uncharacterized protein EDB93DRAFT_1104064 [Suillus bovinus]KAG2147388.1 hypothetical protein EDB93DRAFT_1104064 [Suillus bovinus]